MLPWGVGFVGTLTVVLLCQLRVGQFEQKQGSWWTPNLGWSPGLARNVLDHSTGCGAQLVAVKSLSDLCFKLPTFVWGPESKEEANRLGGSPFSLSNHDPSPCLSFHQGIYLTPSPSVEFSHSGSAFWASKVAGFSCCLVKENGDVRFVCLCIHSQWLTLWAPR